MRIIAGTARGQRIVVPPGTRTRPTTDRVREALFSTLTSELGRAHASATEAWAGLAVLDVFAGSGSLGLEALSRGARSAVFVESDRKVSSILRRNIDHLGLADTQVVVANAQTIADRPERITKGFLPADVIFVDAPYEVTTVDIQSLLAQLLTRNWCSEGAVAVIERSAREDASPWPAPGHENGWQWDPWDERRYGETALWYGRCVQKH